MKIAYRCCFNLWYKMKAIIIQIWCVNWLLLLLYLYYWKHDSRWKFLYFENQCLPSQGWQIDYPSDTCACASASLVAVSIYFLYISSVHKYHKVHEKLEILPVPVTFVDGAFFLQILLLQALLHRRPSLLCRFIIHSIKQFCIKKLFTNPFLCRDSRKSIESENTLQRTSTKCFSP